MDKEQIKNIVETYESSPFLDKEWLIGTIDVLFKECIKKAISDTEKRIEGILYSSPFYEE